MFAYHLHSLWPARRATPLTPPLHLGSPPRCAVVAQGREATAVTRLVCWLEAAARLGGSQLGTTSACSAESLTGLSSSARPPLLATWYMTESSTDPSKTQPPVTLRERQLPMSCPSVLQAQFSAALSGHCLVCNELGSSAPLSEMGG